MDIYIKARKRVTMVGVDRMRLIDMAEVYAPGEIRRKLGELTVCKFPADKKAMVKVSAIQLIETVARAFPDSSVDCVGETDTLVEYLPEQPPQKRLHEILRVALISVVIFMGASTAIMSFHSDGQIPQVFKNYVKVFTGEDTDKPLIVEVPYSIGLTAGIILFFGHFGGKKKKNDPTPVEVEINLYERDLTDTKLSALQKERDGKQEDDENT